MLNNDFIFGAQYYRAPTPSPENWENDLKNMKANGFNCVKFWVQWGWTHRDENEFYFDDIDQLMDLAHKYDLKATINVIFDVAPVWIFDKYPDSKIVLANGTVVEPHSVGHRQIGGFPGTCYNHSAAFNERMRFLQKTIERYKDHPALHMWDMWNEPEQCGTYRYPRLPELPCFCASCKSKFKDYLKIKYSGDIGKLNAVWGKCYRHFDDVQLPTQCFTFSDFIDFREFHLDTMTNEANSRIRLAKSIDHNHPVYLHVVPNTSSIFNALTGVDDFDMAKECDVFASTNFAKPIWSILTTSAGMGKTCYNVECHIGNGNIKMHQKQITLQDMVKDIVPQIGMGLRGFMFWQYRPEILGHEAPAWGVTNLDGSIGSVGTAAKTFIEKLAPYTDEIMQCAAPNPEVAIWKGRKNEILSFCIHANLDGFATSVESYVNAMYYNNYNCRIVDDQNIINGLQGVKLLIMPFCYEASEKLINAVNAFVENGGTLLCEAHLGGYNSDIGRHSYTMPGSNADKLWGIKEAYTTSSYHLKNLADEYEMDTSSFVDDMKKAIDAYGLNGGKNFKIKTALGFSLLGSERFACLDGEDIEVIGTFNDKPCIIKKKHGQGCIYYCGTNLGEAASINLEEFERFVVQVAQSANVVRNPCSSKRGVHVDKLSDNIIIINNASTNSVEITLPGAYHSLYSDRDGDLDTYVAAPESADVLVRRHH